MPYSPTVAAAIARLTSFYNGSAYNVSTNPGGLARGGNRVNFEPSLRDLASVADGVAGEATAAAASSAAASSSATASGLNASAAQGARNEAQRAARDAVAVSGLSGLSGDRRVIRTSTGIKNVVVYDTRLDPDGGAWRKRCRHTSWSAEGASSSRSARVDFPLCTALVLESTRLALYDLDQADAPLWMSFDLGGSSVSDYNILNSGAVDVVRAQGGWIAVAGGSAAIVIDLCGDRVFRLGKSGFRPYRGGIAARNAGKGFGAAIGADVVNATSDIYDVNLCAWPLAPLDPVSGLPLPSVLVATDLGLTVVTPEWKGYDLTVTGGFRRVGVDAPRGVIHAAQATQSVLSMLRAWTILADGAASPLTTFGSVLGASSVRTAGDFASANNCAVGRDFLVAGAPSEGATLGPSINLFDLDTTGAAASLSAMITARYNTGWLLGPALFALADYAAGSATGSANIVSNSTFATNLSGWTAGTGWAQSSGAAAKTAGVASSLSQTLTCVVGVEYAIEFDLTRSAGTMDVRLDGGGRIVTNSYLSAAGHYRGQFIATATSHDVQFSANDTFAGTIDNVDVRPVIADRASAQNGFLINGTLTKAPVASGADLCALSGFSTLNYLSQTYDPDLDLGSGDFTLKFWALASASGVQQTLFHRAAVSGASILVETDTANQINFVISDGTNTATLTAAGATLHASAYQSLLCVRRGSVLELWAGGIRVAVGDCGAVGSLSNASAVARIGLRQNGSNPATNLSLALVSCSPLAPTLEQAQRMVREETALFAAGAAALFGSAGASSYRGAARDPLTGLLFVSSSDGTSVFQGLRRVDHLRSTAGRNRLRNSELRDAIAGSPGTLPAATSVGTSNGLTTNVIAATANSVDLQIVGTPSGAEYALSLEGSTQIGAAQGQDWTGAITVQIVGGTAANVSAIRHAVAERNAGGTTLGKTYSDSHSFGAAAEQLTSSRTLSNASAARVNNQMTLATIPGLAIDITLRLTSAFLAQEAGWSAYESSLSQSDAHLCAGAAGGVVCLASANGAEIILPGLLMRDDLRNPRAISATVQNVAEAEGVTTDSTPLTVMKLPVGWIGEHAVGTLTVVANEDRVDGGVRAHFLKRLTVLRLARGNKTLGNNPIATTNGSTTVTVTDAGHSFVIGQRVALSGVPGAVNNIPAAELNATQVVIGVTGTTWAFSSTTPANATGSGGGASVVVGALSLQSSAVGTDFETTAGTDAVLGVDQAAGTLDVIVTGISSRRIVWKAKIELVRQH